MEQAAMEQTAMKQTAMEKAAMAMRPRTIDKEGSEMPAWPGSDRRALVARLRVQKGSFLCACGIPMATDNNSNNAWFPLARRCCYGKNARSMADASFAAMAGVTDHERISKFRSATIVGLGLPVT